MKPFGIYLVLLFALVSCSNAKTNEDDNDANNSVCRVSFSLGPSGEIFVPAQIDSCSFTLFFDTGAGGLMISDSVAKVLNIPDSLCHRSHFYTPHKHNTDSPEPSSVFPGEVTVMLGDIPVKFDSIEIVKDFHFVFQSPSNAIMSIPCNDERVWMINNDNYLICVSDSLDTQDYEYTYNMVVDRQLFVTDLCLSLSNSSDTISITNDFLIDTGSNIDITVLGIGQGHLRDSLYDFARQSPVGFRYLWTTIDEFILHESNILNKDVEVSFQYPVYHQANLLGLGWLYHFNYAFDIKHNKFYLQRRETNSLRQAILQNTNASFTIFDTSDRDVIVLAINDTSSYYEAGLRLYDRILSVDGKDFDTKYFKEKAIGDTIQITISHFPKDTLLLKVVK